MQQPELLANTTPADGTTSCQHITRRRHNTTSRQTGTHQNSWQPLSVQICVQSLIQPLHPGSVLSKPPGAGDDHVNQGCPQRPPRLQPPPAGCSNGVRYEEDAALGARTGDALGERVEVGAAAGWRDGGGGAWTLAAALVAAAGAGGVGVAAAAAAVSGGCSRWPLRAHLVHVYTQLSILQRSC